MEIFLFIITIFPVLVSILLRGRYFVLVLILASINAIAIVASGKYARPTPQITGKYLTISTFNIIFACIIWYLAFKPRPGTALSGQKDGLRKLLGASGLVIVLGTIFIIASFAAFLYVLLHSSN